MSKRNTIQKDIIRSTLCSLTSHPTAPMLYERIHREHPSISRSTVYRVLGQLAEEGAILRLGVAGSENRYDATTAQHSHIRCRVCGRVDDLPAADIPPVEDSAGYCIESCSVVYSGVCASCGENGIVRMK